MRVKACDTYPSRRTSYYLYLRVTSKSHRAIPRHHLSYLELPRAIIQIASGFSGLQRTPADTPTYSRDLVRLSDRAKYLALYNIHSAHPIGIANVHTPAD